MRVYLFRHSYLKKYTVLILNIYKINKVSDVRISLKSLCLLSSQNSYGCQENNFAIYFILSYRIKSEY